MEYNIKKIKIKDWEEYEKGIILFENNQILLTAYMPVDYIIDGYRIYRKEYIEGFFVDDEVLVNKKVINKRAPDLPFNFELISSSFEEISQSLISKYGVIELIYSDEESFFVTKIGSNKFDIEFINPYGKVFSSIPFDFQGIEYCKAIGVDSDYLNALLFLKEEID